MTLAWDPAGRESTNKKTDFHGLTVVGNDSADVWWFMKAEELKLPLDQLLEHVALTIRNYAIMKVSIETRGAGMQGLYIDLLKPVLKRFGLEHIPIHEWSPGNAESKDTQIRSLQPRHRQGRWWFRKGYCEPLIDQLDDFPQLAHDDVLDSAVQHKVVSRPAQLDDVDPGASNEGDFDREEGTGEQESFGAPSVGLGAVDYTAALGETSWPRTVKPDPVKFGKMTKSKPIPSYGSERCARGTQERKPVPACRFPTIQETVRHRS